jgi:hypothetical protein
MLAAFPIGIIDQPTPNGCIFSFTRPTDRDLPHGTELVVHNQVGQEMARFRGHLTEVSHTTGSMLITHSDISPDWPQQIDPMGAGNGVYLGVPGTYDPDIARVCETPEEFEFLIDVAQQHKEMTGLPHHYTAYAVRPPQDDSEAGPDWRAE